MKKLLLLLIVVAMAPFAFGQFSFGPRVGFTTSKLSSDQDTISASIGNTFDFGVFLRLGKKVYIQPEIIISSKTNEIKYKLGGKQDIKINTFDIPVMLGWKIMSFGVGNVRVMAGPSAELVYGKSIEYKNIDEPLKEADIENMIWSVNVGAGIDVLMFTFDIRYKVGLTEMVKQVNATNFNLVDNSFKISLGWKIL